MRSSSFVYGLFLLCFSPFFPLSGQNTDTLYPVELLPAYSQSLIDQQHIPFPQSCSDSSKFQQELQIALQQLQLAGYLEAAVDSFSLREKKGCKVYLHTGPHYYISAIVLDSLPPALQEDRIIRKLTYAQQQLPPQRLLTQILDRAANIGYPFARTELSHLLLKDSQATIRLRIHSGDFIRMGTIRLPENSPIAASFLARYLGLAPGAPYQHERILAVPQKIDDLGYLSLEQPPGLVLKENSFDLLLQPLPSPRRNNFDFMIGLLPQTSSGGLLLTASLRAGLNNALGKGETIRFNFERLRPQTQSLELALNYPYLLRLPVATDLQFNLYRRDSSYLDVFGELSLQYLLGGQNHLRVFWKQHRSNLINTPEPPTDANYPIPADLDLLRRFFGMGFYLQKLDYVFNPRKGWMLRFNASAGSRKILPNSRVEENGYETLYTQLQLRSVQYQLQGQAAYYLPLFKQSTLKLALDGRQIINPTEVFRNEQFRLGGNRLLRGFDEESIFATRYLLLSIEYRLLIDKNAYLAVFGDRASIADESPTGKLKRYPFGLGAGINFETRAGRFQFNLAWGKIDDEPWDLNNPRVHFGYVSLF